MRPPSIFLRAAVALAVLVVAGCTPGESNAQSRQGEAPPISAQPDPTASSSQLDEDPEDVPIDDTDYSTDAGTKLREYEYPDDPIPADSIIATLCNLNQEYLANLGSTDPQSFDDDGSFQTVLIGFSDVLEEWNSLRPHFPEHVEDIDRAQALYAAWDNALKSKEGGDFTDVEQHLEEAEALLEELPEGPNSGCFD
ncbi:MAG TPA: hypothetical protein VK098_05630 [Beutenbergiaceae bacterium]|nr:hypothetical protein [Beutenbergiaceae bacterium]